MFQLNEKIYLAVFEIKFELKNLLKSIFGGKDFTEKKN